MGSRPIGHPNFKSICPPFDGEAETPAGSQLLAAEGEPSGADETGDEADRCNRWAEDVDAALAEGETTGRHAEADRQVMPDRWNDAEDPEENERPDAEAGSRERGPCKRAAEERDRGIGDERQPLEDCRGDEPGDGQRLE